MTKIYDANLGCKFNARKILFDTNIWLAIDGNDPRDHYVNYSNFFGEVLMSDNKLITNDYVISEYFNRACKIQYDLTYKGEEDRRKYKERRKAGDLAEYMNAVRDSCLDIIKDCVFESAVNPDCGITELIHETSNGQMDFSDIIIREHCAKNGYVLVSDDGDFLNCGIELVTSNPWVLREARKNGTLSR